MEKYIMMFWTLDDVTSEAVAVDLAESLINEALEAKHATRGKRKKIRLAQSKIEKLRDKCFVMKWNKPIEGLKAAFNSLEQCIGELDVNLWGI